MIFCLRSCRIASILLCLFLFGVTQLAHATANLNFGGLVRTLNTTGGTALNSPSALVVDPAGDVYIADLNNNQNRGSERAGYSVGSCASLGLSPASLSSPWGIAIDGAGNLYITDVGNNRVVKVSPSGAGSTISTGGLTLSSPLGVTLDQSGNIFIADTGHSRIVEVTSGGSATALTINVSSGPALLSGPRGLAVDGSGTLYISDSINNRVVTVAAGSTTGVVLNTGGLSCGLSNASSVAVDRIGNVFIADPSHHRIAEVDTAGVGTDLANSLSLSLILTPLGVAVDAFGAVYIADTSNNRALVVDPGLNGNPVSGSYTSSLNKTAVGFGHITLGSSTPTSLILNFTVGAPVAGLGGVNVFTAGVQGLDFQIVSGVSTTCSSSSGFGACTAEISFLPTAPGLRNGAVVLYGPSLNPVLTVLLYGFGDAPVAALAPNTGTVVSTGGVPVVAPFQIALDGAGNIYDANDGGNLVKIPFGGGTASVVSTSGFPFGSEIAGVAVDGAGNLFISDHRNSRIIVITPGHVASQLSIAGPALGYPTALAFDAAGDLYISDYTNGRIIEVWSLFVAGTTSQGIGTVIGMGNFTTGTDEITGVAVDFMGNIYIPDGYNGVDPSRIIKVTTAGVASLLTPNGITFSRPEGVGADGMGNLYIADGGHNRIVEITTAGVASVLAINGLPVPSTLGSPFGVTVDPSGNLYIPDSGNNRVLFVNVSGTALPSFPTTATGATSTSKTATVTNLGNQPLIFSANPTYTTNFSSNSADINPCTSSTSLLPGLSCDVSVQFTPQSVGSLSAGMMVTNDTLNVSGSTQQVSVSGTAFSSIQSTTTTVTVLPASSTYGQSVTFTTTVSSTGTPTGTVTFTDLTTSTTLAFNVSLSSGVATFSSSALGVGSHTIQAVYTPTGNFSTSTGTVTLTIVRPAPPPTSSVSLSSSANPSALGEAVTFTAAVSGQPATSGFVTGTVQFSDGATALGTTNVSGGVAEFTTSALTGGSHNIGARYSGNGTFPPAQASYRETVNASVTVTISVAPTAPVFGQALVFTANVTAAPASGFAAPTGHVTWVDLASGAQLGTAPLSSGTAALSLNSLTAGTHVINVLYSGDANWSYAASSLSITVSRATSSSAVSIATVSGQVTLTAAVSSVAPGAGVPTGSVQFVDVAKNTVTATSTLTGGTGSATIGPAAAQDARGRPIAAVNLGDSNFNGSTSSPLPALVSAAWNFSGYFAPDEIASLYGITGLPGNATATPPLTTSLSGVTVTITDSSGAVRPALLYGVYSSAGQINLLVPSGTVAGLAAVTITLPGGGTITTVVNIVGTAPGIFTSDMTGQGNYAGQVVYVHQDGSQTIMSSTGPISLIAGDQVYLVLYGTGLRNASSVKATVNGASVPVIFHGAQGADLGVDQINLGPLPANLAGAGVVKLVIDADGEAANPVTLNFQ